MNGTTPTSPPTGALDRQYACPRGGSAVACPDEMRPETVKSWKVQRVLQTASSEQPRRSAGRARQEVDDGRSPGTHALARRIDLTAPTFPR